MIPDEYKKYVSDEELNKWYSDVGGLNDGQGGLGSRLILAKIEEMVTKFFQDKQGGFFNSNYIQSKMKKLHKEYIKKGGKFYTGYFFETKQQVFDAIRQVGQSVWDLMGESDTDSLPAKKEDTMKVEDVFPKENANRDKTLPRSTAIGDKNKKTRKKRMKVSTLTEELSSKKLEEWWSSIRSEVSDQYRMSVTILRDKVYSLFRRYTYVRGTTLSGTVSAVDCLLNVVVHRYKNPSEKLEHMFHKEFRIDIDKQKAMFIVEYTMGLLRRRRDFSEVLRKQSCEIVTYVNTQGNTRTITRDEIRFVVDELKTIWKGKLINERRLLRYAYSICTQLYFQGDYEGFISWEDNHSLREAIIDEINTEQAEPEEVLKIKVAVSQATKVEPEIINVPKSVMPGKAFELSINKEEVRIACNDIIDMWTWNEMKKCLPVANVMYCMVYLVCKRIKLKVDYDLFEFWESGSDVSDDLKYILQACTMECASRYVEAKDNF